MSITAVPISIFFVRAPTAASSGNGEPSWRAKWWTRKYAPSAPSSSTASASSIDWMSASAPDRTCEYGDVDQCPKDRNPIFFTELPGGRPAGVARRPLVGGSLAEDRGLDPELEQPVRVADL